ncbi:hypothetical protein KIPB_011845, partial [Kipferlia bialata]
RSASPKKAGRPRTQTKKARTFFRPQTTEERQEAADRAIQSLDRSKQKRKPGKARKSKQMTLDGTTIESDKEDGEREREAEESEEEEVRPTPTPKKKVTKEKVKPGVNIFAKKTPSKSKASGSPSKTPQAKRTPSKARLNSSFGM